MWRHMTTRRGKIAHRKIQTFDESGIPNIVVIILHKNDWDMKKRDWKSPEISTKRVVGLRGFLFCEMLSSTNALRWR